MTDHNDQFGDIRTRCGMSEYGAARFNALHFKRRPCSKCPESVRRILDGTTRGNGMVTP